MEDMPVLLTRKQAAEYLNIRYGLLNTWAFKGVGPKFVKLGDGRNAPTRYSKKDLDDFIGVSRISAASKED
jgi:hypothetical protein